ncbi:MAG: M24 family metallopeptidase [Phycisphaerales bacterium]|nr:M24 family metallopeptidase [Phycisphaerales bacterium]
MSSTAIVMAGIPSVNRSLYREMQFSVGDPAALIRFPGNDSERRLLILRDIEMERAREQAAADEIACPADFAPASGLSGDRETATAQAVAECLKRAGVNQITSDRTLPLSFVDEIRKVNIEISYDPDLGVIDRRRKRPDEIEHLRQAQRDTETAIRMACETIAAATPDRDGVLQHDKETLTSERVRAMIDLHLLRMGYETTPSIVAGGPQGGDCHQRGSGPLRTGEPVIIDVFPRNQTTLYVGDCTRCVVHGEIPPVIASMHAAIVEAKAAATAATRSGVTGEAVHQATLGVIHAHGFASGLPAADDPDDRIAMVHGTGHGVGLDVHEPPLLDFGGPVLVDGDALTIEPGLYAPAIGGLRVEDMVIATASGAENLNTLPEGLDWST